MRLTWLILSFCAAALAHAESPESSASDLTKIELIKIIPAEGARKLLGHEGNRFYLAKADGSVKVITLGKDRTETFTLPAKGARGEPILKRPEAAAASGDTIYVVDSELNHVAMYSADGKYKASFGRKGSAEGEMYAPRSIALHDGILYVADSGNGRIELFGDNGVFLETLGIERAPANNAAKEKKLPYLLNKPTAITLDPAGRTIYVLDRKDGLFGTNALLGGNPLFGGNTSIKTYGPDGTFLGEFPQNGKFTAISAVPDGLYAAEEDGNTIRKYDPNGKLASSFAPKGDARAQFRSMDGMAADNGQVYLADSAHGAIFDFRTNTPTPSVLEPRQTTRAFVRWSGTTKASVSRVAWNGKDTLYGITKEGGIIRIRNGVKEGGEIKFKKKEILPVAIDVDSSGALWVLDKNKRQVVKLDASGNMLSAFGMPTGNDGQSDDPIDVAVSSTGVIFVADAGTNRILSFSDNGGLLNAFGNSASGKALRLRAIALDPQDNLYVLDASRATVSVYSSKGEPLVEFGQNQIEASGNLQEPHGLMATKDEVFVAEANRIKVYSHDGKYLRSFGTSGWDNGELRDVVSIAENDATSIFVAERGNERIQTFTTLYRPDPPRQVIAQGRAHAIELSWTPCPQAYVTQYQIYRSKDETTGFVRISASKTNQFSDEGLPPDEPYFYRVAAETNAGYEGLASSAVSATPQKYTPSRPENIQVTPTPPQLKMSWNPLDLRYISAYLVYSKEGDAYTKVGETVAPEFTTGPLMPATDYTFYVAARSVDGIESEKAVVHAATLAGNRKPAR